MRAFFQERLGAPMTFTGHDLFRGNTTTGTPTEIEVHTPNPGAPLNGVLIRYRVLQ